MAVLFGLEAYWADKPGYTWVHLRPIVRHASEEENEDVEGVKDTATGFK